jgi:hypothetical protein
MALAQILDLDEARRRRAAARPLATPAMGPSNDVLAAWCYLWMPMYFWYVG